MNTEKTNTYRDQVEKELTAAAKALGEPTPRSVLKPVPLRVGDRLRANGYIYQVRKLTSKGLVLKTLGVETTPGVVVPRG